MARERQKNLRRSFRHSLDWEIVLVAMAFFIAPNVHIYLRGEHREAIESSAYSTVSFILLRFIFFVIYYLIINYRVWDRGRRIHNHKK